MNDSMVNWWAEAFRFIITTLIFAFYIALTFFAFRGNFDFIFSYEYWLTTLSSTTIAWFLRYLWSFKGVESTLIQSKEISEKEQGKASLIAEINKRNLTNVVETEIDKTNRKEKLKQYKNKCERKIKIHQSRFMFKKYNSKRLEYWRNERKLCDKDDFNVDIVKVKYYKYDIDSMLSATYKPNSEIETRGNINDTVLKSYRTNIITLIGFALIGGLQVFVSNFSNEDLFILLGRLLIFTINIYSGLMLGINFVKGKYSNDITKDFVFMKSILKENE